MKRSLPLIVLCSLFSFALKAQYNKIVAKDGTGDYTTLQAAIDAAPTNSATAWVIFIKNGKYYEKINVPSNKPNLQLIGESVANVMVYYDDYAGKPITGGGTLGTQNSASIIINANDFVAVNVTFANTFNYDSAAAAGVTGSQAVAVTINADRSAFKNCRFIGMQDTLYTKGGGTPRHYFYKCYIDGIVDFIFGSSIAVFDSCVIYPKSRTGTGSSYITAANTTTGQAYGYVFRDCKIPANTSATLYFLGRPWNNATGGITAENKVVFLNATMSSSIQPAGWSVWDAGTNTSIITNAEYKSKRFDGGLVDISNRVVWSKQFANADTVGYNINNMFSGWNPCSVRADFCTSPTTEIAVSNFKGIKSGSNANFSWNISWAITGITYDLYKSINNKASFNILSTTTATNDTSINFSGTDALPPAGASYFYFVKASMPGSTTSYTDTIEISSIPTIVTITNSLTNFLQGSTAPSGSQTYIVSGTNLLNDIIIKTPTNYEISVDNSIWKTDSLILTQIAGTIANTMIYVRLNAASAGNYSGNIVHSTIGVSTTHTKIITVSGTTQSTPLLSFDILQQWNLTTNNLDDATVRATGLVATTPTLNRLNLSNGTQVAAVPAYSTLYGQAIAPSVAGDGMWTTASGGSGGTLNRTLYEQFTIKPDVNYSVRIDSLVALIGYYGSTSNTKIAVVYSKSNFATDSANVTGGRDVSGLTLSGTANGAFTTPIVVAATSNSANTSQYALALNAGTGVQINAGETLTIRIYLSCGSTSAGRYAVIKNVQFKGLVPTNLPVKIASYIIKLNNKKQVNNIWTTSSEINTSHFNIQRSLDGRNFMTIGKVSAKGVSTYAFIDEDLPTNNSNITVYYRLEIVDNNGHKANSETKQIVINDLSIKSMNVFPNPATNALSLKIVGSVSEIIPIQVVDVLGKVCINERLKLSDGSTSIDISRLKKGTYHIKAIAGKEILTSRFIVD